MKTLELRPGLDIPAAMNFNAATFVDSYISTFHTLSPVELYLDQIEQYAATNHPTLTYPNDIIRQRRIISDPLPQLPGSLPYLISSQSADFAEIPATQRYQIDFELRDSSGNTLFLYTADLPTIADKRVTLAYDPATSADQALLDLYGDLFATPPDLIYLKPVLRIGGVAVAQGGRVRPGDQHILWHTFDPPSGEVIGGGAISHRSVAGEYHGIAFDPYRVHLGGVLPVSGTPDSDGLLGEQLYRTAMAYLDRQGQSWELTADTMQVVYATSVAQAVVTNALTVWYTLGGNPVIWDPEGLNVDAQNKTVGGAFSVADGNSELIPFMTLVGADGSILENRVFEDLYGQEAISTIKVLELAADAAIPICVMTAGNLGDCSTIYQSAYLVAMMNLALNLGYEVVAPRDALTHHDWHGGGFIARNPVTKEGYWYIIEGGLNGGATVDDLVDWVNEWKWVFRIVFGKWCTDEPAVTAEIISPPSPPADSYWPYQKDWLSSLPMLEPWNIRDLKPVFEVDYTTCFDINGTKVYSELTQRYYPIKAPIVGSHTFTTELGTEITRTFTVFDVVIDTPEGIYAPTNGDGLQMEARVVPELPPDATFAWAQSGTGTGDYSTALAAATTFTGTTTGNAVAKVTVTNPNGSVSDEQVITVFGVEVLNSQETYMGKGYNANPPDFPDAAPPEPAQISYYIEGATHPEQGLFIAREVTMTVNSGNVVTYTAPLSMSLPGTRDTTWNGLNLDANFVPTGLYQAQIAVEAPNGKTAVSDPYNIRVVEVTSVEFFDLAGNAITCPAVPAACNQHPTHPGGVRIFPGSLAAGQPRNNKVEVRATLDTAVPITAALPIYFRSYDVDDPTGLINVNHFDTVENIPEVGKFVSPVGYSDGDTTVDVDFLVTMQPGDNFKVFASTNPNFLIGLDDVTVEQTMHISGTGVTTDTVLQPLASERLTVWRKLHMEIDSMMAVTDNQVTGDITIVTNNGATSFVTTTAALLEPDSPPTATHRFEDGVLTDNAGVRFDVITNTHGMNLMLEVTNNPGGIIPVVGPFTLVDDDFNGDDAGNLDGDMGEDIDDPDLSMVMESDLITENIFAQVYIHPSVYSAGGEVPFVLNAPPNNSFTSIFGFDNATTKDSVDFWTIYLVGAYQYSTDVDSDPNPVPGMSRTHGVADAGRTGAALFKATNSETAAPTCQEPIIVAHEIGHLFGVSGHPHPSHGDLMEANCRVIGVLLAPDTQTIIRHQQAP